MHIGDFWNSEGQIGTVVAWLDYACVVDVIAALVVLLIWKIRPKRLAERKLTLVTGIISLVAALLWVADAKLAHRLSDIQAKGFREQIKLAAEGAISIDPKDDIRRFFSTVNPEVLPLIDSGKTPIRLMIGSMNEARLSTLAKRKDFDKYLTFEQTPAQIFGGTHNQLGGFINESSENGGTLEGFIFYPKDALRQ